MPASSPPKKPVSNGKDSTPPKDAPRRPPLSHYRMALLGSEGIRKYYETGYIPEVLQD